MCLYPKYIENKKYKANKKNRGIIPACKDKRALIVPVSCGNCMECRKQKARTWKVRLQEEIRTNHTGKFVTMSFSPSSLEELSTDITGLSGYELENEIATLAVRRFLERWRKKYKKSIRHWIITELGQTSTERIHLHGILFTQNVEDIGTIWKYGHVFVGDYVNERTVNYIVKYVHKIDSLHKEYKSKILTSPGIGSGYMDRVDAKNKKYIKGETKTYYTARSGHKLSLPTYYRNHIFNEEEREKIWLDLLDKNERWINGVKIDISEGEEQYYKVLETARDKNRRLGYGDNTINWERRIYENQRRIYLKKVRFGDKE